MDIIVTTLVSHVAGVTKIFWCYSLKEQDFFFLLTSQLMPAVGKAMGDVLGGEMVLLLHPAVLRRRVVLTRLYKLNLRCLVLLPKMRKVFPCNILDQLSFNAFILFDDLNPVCDFTFLEVL